MGSENLLVRVVLIFFRQSGVIDNRLTHTPCGVELLGIRRLASFPQINRALLLLLELDIVISS
jgi:hypothetical protein